MGRWIVLEEDDFVRDNSDGWCGSCASEDDAKNIARRHKQECDHYEQRIAELESRIIWTVSSLEDMIKYCDSRKLQEEFANVIAIAKGMKQ